jgi:ubiquinone/menaquinone biosynthesis C-methylase UbiE
VQAQVADAEKLPFANGSFDQAIMSQVLPYVGNVEAAVKEASRVLVQGGTAVVSVPDSRRLAWMIFGFLYSMLPNVKASQRKATTPFTRISVVDCFANNGFRALKYRYICGAELVIVFQKVE